MKSKLLRMISVILKTYLNKAAHHKKLTQARRNKWGTRARAHPIFETISSKIVVVPTQYLSPIKCVPTQYLIPSYGPANYQICRMHKRAITWDSNKLTLLIAKLPHFLDTTPSVGQNDFKIFQLSWQYIWRSLGLKYYTKKFILRYLWVIKHSLISSVWVLMVPLK